MPLYHLVCILKAAVPRRGVAEVLRRAAVTVHDAGGVVTDIKSYGTRTLAYDIRLANETHKTVRRAPGVDLQMLQPLSTRHSRRALLPSDARSRASTWSWRSQPSRPRWRACATRSAPTSASCAGSSRSRLSSRRSSRRSSGAYLLVCRPSSTGASIFGGGGWEGSPLLTLPSRSGEGDDAQPAAAPS